MKNEKKLAKDFKCLRMKMPSGVTYCKSLPFILNLQRWVTKSIQKRVLAFQQEKLFIFCLKKMMHIFKVELNSYYCNEKKIMIEIVFV